MPREQASDFVIRPTLAADAAAVSALLEISYTTLLRDHYDAATLAAALPLMTRARPDLLESGTYFLALAADGLRPLGCGGWTATAPQGPSTAARAHIRHFATHPAAARSGVGRALLRRCLREIAEAGFAEAECLSTLMAEPFYVSEGFRPQSRETVRLGGAVDFPAVKMLRHI